jgi:hypothetical protein
MYQFLGTLGEAPVQPGGARAAAQKIAPQVAAQAASVSSQEQAANQANLVEAGKAALGQEESQARQSIGQQALAAQSAISAAGRAAELGEARKDIASQKELLGAELTQREKIQERGLRLDSQANFLSNKQREDLANLGGDLDDKLFSSRLQFDYSEGKRKFGNERQLEDWAVSRATSKVDRDKQLRKIQQQAEFDVQAMDILSRKVQQKIDQDLKDAVQRGDQETKRELTEMRAAFERKKAKALAQSERMRTLIKVGVGVGAAVAIFATSGAAAPAIAAGAGIAAS